MRLLAKLITVGLISTSTWARNDPAPIPDEVIDKVVNRALVRGQNVLPEKVRLSVERAAQELERVGGPATRAQTSAATGRVDLESLRLEARTQLATTRARLAGQPGQLKALDELSSKVEERFTRVLNALAAVETSQDDGSHKAAVAAARNVLRSLRAPADNSSVITKTIPTFTYDTPLKNAAPQVPAAQPPQYVRAPEIPSNMLAFNDATLIAGTPPVVPTEATQCSYLAGDLDKSATAQFEVRTTPELTALADSLDYSPVKIFKWVYDNIKYEPYYGSLKGAQGTFISRAGNDTDQASLLISLLRSSNIPARYVKGQVLVIDATPQTTNARIAKWLGVKSYAAAANVLAQGRNPGVGFYPNSTSPTGIGFIHVWVEACVPYGHYRGAKIDNVGHRWIPLDPSFRETTYQAGIAVPAATVLDYTTYLSKRRNGPDSLPHEYYAQNQVKTYIKSLNANNTLEDVPYRSTNNPLRVDILPASLPFQVNQFLAWPASTSAEATVLPDAHRYKLVATVANGAATQLATTTLQLPEHILKRITLSPKGATPADQTNLDNWRNDGSLITSPPSTNIVPVIKSDGVDQVVGTVAVDLTTTNNQLKLEVTLPELGSTATCTTAPGPGCVNAVQYTNIGAANYHALQAYGFQASDQHLANRAKKLLDSVRLTPNPNTNLEETEGEFLNVVGLKYMRYISDAGKSVGQLDGGSGESSNHIGLTSTQMKVAYLFDLPFAVNRTGFLVDVPGGRSRNVDIVRRVGLQVLPIVRLCQFCL